MEKPVKTTIGLPKTLEPQLRDHGERTGLPNRQQFGLATNRHLAAVEKALLRLGFTAEEVHRRPRAVDVLTWRQLADVEKRTGVPRNQLLALCLRRYLRE